MLGDLKFCFMFVTLCLSVCFRNVGCWHVPGARARCVRTGLKEKSRRNTYLTGRLASSRRNTVGVAPPPTSDFF